MPGTGGGTGTYSRVAAAAVGSVREAELPGDEHPLHLAGALTDLENLGVAPVPGHRELVDETVAPEHLRRVAGVVDRNRGGVQLRDRRLPLERLAGRHPRGRVVVGEARDVRAHLHVRDP